MRDGKKDAGTPMTLATAGDSAEGLSFGAMEHDPR